MGSGRSRRQGFTVEATAHSKIRPILLPLAAARSNVGTLVFYRFRPVTESDLPLLAQWRAQPHVQQWWGSPDDEDAAETLAEGCVAMWIVEHEGRPFAYAQDYSPHDSDDHPFAHLPPGARGIDQYIGEPGMLGQGHGSAFVRQHVERLFAGGAPVVGTDPHPDNARAIGAYSNAGFVIASDPKDTRWGRAVLMECRKADINSPSETSR